MSLSDGGETLCEDGNSSAVGLGEDRNNSRILKCVKIVSWWFYVAYGIADWIRKENILVLVFMALAIIHCRQAVPTK
jgi:hypothetical protein